MVLKTRACELLIKKTIQQTANISEIRAEEKDRILKELLSLKAEELGEKIRVLVYETVKANIINKNAVVILQRENDDKQFLLV
jgi:hypothetical protein